MLGEPLKNAKEKEIIGSLSPQVSICEEDGPILTEGRDTSIKPLSIDEMRSSAITKALDPKIRKPSVFTVASHLSTIDKVLEKAHMDYESKSQKECQDILDSIDDLIDFEGLKERASNCSDQNHSSICSLERMIPQVDGSVDDLFSIPCAGSTGNSSKSEMKNEFEGYSEFQSSQDFGARLTIKHKIKQSK